MILLGLKIGPARNNLTKPKKLQLELSQHIEGLRAWIKTPDEFSYNPVPLKPAFSVHATYKHIGKLKPRQFPIDE